MGCRKCNKQRHVDTRVPLSSLQGRVYSASAQIYMKEEVVFPDRVLYSGNFYELSFSAIEQLIKMGKKFIFVSQQEKRAFYLCRPHVKRI